MSFAREVDFPDLTNNSKTLSKAAESEFPGVITGFKHSKSLSLKNLLIICCS